jgi:hypothetical protein
LNQQGNEAIRRYDLIIGQFVPVEIVLSMNWKIGGQRKDHRNGLFQLYA